MNRLRLHRGPGNHRNARLRAGLAAVVAASGLAAGFVNSGSAQAATTISFTTSGEHTFTVPPGVTNVVVVAVGATGGLGTGGLLAPGGSGGQVTVTLPVTPGENFFAEVGVGGGTGGMVSGGDGGGAADLRRCSTLVAPLCGPLTGDPSTDPRLIVAGGGGGGGGAFFTAAGNGGAGGALPAAPCPVPAGPGLAADGLPGANAVSGGGAGGIAGTCTTGGLPLSPGVGAAGATPGSPGGGGGGGGGGGWWGGGGGGGVVNVGGGGGGGGSSFGPPGSMFAAGPPGGASLTISFNTADLSITKTGPASATSGDAVAYTITVHNNGPDPATGVTVIDTLPSGVTFVSAPGCLQAPIGTVTCSVPGTLANGASALFTVTVTADPVSAPSSRTNKAKVKSDGQDPDMSNNGDFVTTTVNPPAQPATPGLPGPPGPPGHRGPAGKDNHHHHKKKKHDDTKKLDDGKKHPKRKHS